jgi:hypothetical protein
LGSLAPAAGENTVALESTAVMRALLARCFTGTLLMWGFAAPAGSALAQAVPSPAPPSSAEQNAAIIKPLSEIGRVRARTAYCAALGRARPGIDAAIAYEFEVPKMAQTLRHFRLDSELTKAQSLKQTEHDLTALWNLAVAGRDQVRALRAAAHADGVDDQKRAEMLAFADALDGAKARQMMLAKRIARVVGTLAERRVVNIANTPADDHGSPSDPRAATDDQANLLDNIARTQELFGTFAAEEYIKDDLKVAAEHGNKAMQLGGCAGA